MAMVANLVLRHKGQDIAMDALKGKPWMNREWRLNIYGDGPDETFLRSMAEHHPSKAKITFHGRVSDITGVWKKNHILLMPSRME